LVDPAGHQYSANTDGGGAFSFTSSQSAPIVAGTIYIGVQQKDGYNKPSTKSYSIAAGGSKTDITFALVPITASAERSPFDHAVGRESLDPNAGASVDASATDSPAAGAGSTAPAPTKLQRWPVLDDDHHRRRPRVARHRSDRDDPDAPQGRRR